MRSLAYALPPLPGFDSPKTYAIWPVWSGGTTDEIEWPKVVKEAVVAWYHKARNWNALKQAAGRYGGTLGSACLRVLECLAFDYQNYRTGQLDPSYEGIAAKTGLSRSTIAKSLRRLKEFGIIHWQQRNAHHWQDGKFQLKQLRNAYMLLSPSYWRGIDARPEAQPPDPGTWGDHPPLPDAITQAITERKDGGTLAQTLARLEDDPTDELAAALSRLGRHIEAKENTGSA